MCAFFFLQNEITHTNRNWLQLLSTTGTSKYPIGGHSIVMDSLYILYHSLFPFKYLLCSWVCLCTMCRHKPEEDNGTLSDGITEGVNCLVGCGIKHGSSGRVVGHLTTEISLESPQLFVDVCLLCCSSFHHIHVSVAWHTSFPCPLVCCMFLYSQVLLMRLLCVPIA